MSYNKKSSLRSPKENSFDEISEDEKKKITIKIKKENLVRKQDKHVSLYYDIEEVIGEGSFGKVYKIKHKKLKQERALKVVNKVIKQNYTSFEELEILKKLDHPNVLKIFQYYQSAKKWYIVTQYFEGKELFDQIIDEKALSQHKAAIIFNEILKAISYIHSQQIVHRDIKPENILVKCDDKMNFTIKVIDWGLGAIGGKQLWRKCGTPQYCAPEVINGNYGFECDLWSLGIVLFVMLAGKFPFKGDSVSETLDLVKKGNLSFKGEEWNGISLQAKLLIKKLLKTNPKERITAQQCLKDEWILKNINDRDSCDKNELKQTLIRMKQFAIENKFQAVVINFIQNYLSTPKELSRLKKQFQALDANKDGVLSYEELYDGYRVIYGDFDAKKIVEDIFISIDLDGSGQIQYSQFITFATQIHTKFSKEQLKQAFRLFDNDNDGKIDKKEINNLLIYEKGTQSQQFDDILAEIDLNNDGSIDLDEFIMHINKAVQKVTKLQQKETEKQEVSDTLKE